MILDLRKDSRLLYRHNRPIINNNNFINLMQKSTELANDSLFKIEGSLKCLFLVISMITLPIAKFKFIQVLVGVAACLLGLKRQIPTLGFTKESA